MDVLLTEEREDRVISGIMSHKTPTQQELVKLEKSVTNILGQGVEFLVILVPEIKLEPNGKFRVSHSFLNSSYNGLDLDYPQTIKAPYNSRNYDEPR